MLSPEEETRIRDTVRRSLENILGDTAHAAAEPQAVDAERLVEAKAIIAQETEKYYAQLGMVKHLSRGGQVFWVSPREEERLRQRRQKKAAPSWLARVKPSVALVWAVTILVASLLVAYLLSTDVFSGLGAASN